MADAAAQGRFLWYELLTTDMKAAEKFYTTVVGWTVTPFPESPQPYDMWTRADGTPIAGCMTIPQGMNFPSHWGMYVGVKNLEAGVAAIEKAGGSALSPVIDVPTVGRMRTMTDPQGAAYSIYEPVTPPTPEATPELGDISWRELYTTDASAAVKFYGDLYGWRERSAMDMGPMGKYHIFGGDRDMGGIMEKPPEMDQAPPHWGLYFRVPDINQGAERVKANGGKVLNGPMDVPGGSKILNCMDPQGGHFSLHQL